MLDVLTTQRHNFRKATNIQGEKSSLKRCLGKSDSAVGFGGLEKSVCALFLSHSEGDPNNVTLQESPWQTKPKKGRNNKFMNFTLFCGFGLFGCFILGKQAQFEFWFKKFRVPEKGGRQEKFDHFFSFSGLFYSLFLMLLLPFCVTSFAKLLLPDSFCGKVQFSLRVKFMNRPRSRPLDLRCLVEGSQVYTIPE